jgi:enediyne biosynthesis protein CalE5
LTNTSEQEFLGDVRFKAADDYFSSLMDIAAPIQNLWGKLSPDQQTEAKQRIIHTAGQHRNGAAIALPIAVRMVTARKPG